MWSSEYYRVLGLEDNAGLADIKKQYRKKAKLLHPDINKNLDAHEKFILLNEAYEYLIKLKSGKVYDSISQKFKKSEQSSSQYANAWFDTEQESARDRARDNANMAYDQFVNTRFYKNALAIGTIIDFFNITVSITYLASPIIGYFFYGSRGLLGGILIAFVTVAFWAEHLFLRREWISPNKLLGALVHVLKTWYFWVFIGGISNILVFLQVGINTLIPVIYLTCMYLLMIVLGYLITSRRKSGLMKWMASLVIAPGMISLVLLLNYTFSQNPVIEKYKFTHQLRWYSYRFGHGRFEKITFIDLEDNMYHQYAGIRNFIDFQAMEHKSKITYRFEDGLFGLRVMKDYYFD